MASLVYAGALLLIGWGTAHLVATPGIIREFPGLSTDNRLIVRMEWLTEGFALLAAGGIPALVTMFDPDSQAATVVYWAVFVELNTLSVISLLTGFRVHFLPFRLCPLVFTGASLLILAGGVWL